MTSSRELIASLEQAKEPIKAYLGEEYTSVLDVAEENTKTTETPRYYIFPASSNVTNHFESLLIKKRGAPYRNPAPHSRYSDPITSNENYKGRSRIWADADLESQERVVEDTVKLCKQGTWIRQSPKKKYNNTPITIDDRLLSFVIAIMRIESGFNIDAAAGTTSASSLGQFIKKTGRAYGIRNDTVWDFVTNASALINHSLDNYSDALSKGLGEEYIYALHHDGPSLNDIGLQLSNEKIMPEITKIQKLIETYKG